MCTQEDLSGDRSAGAEVLERDYLSEEFLSGGNKSELEVEALWTMIATFPQHRDPFCAANTRFLL